MPPSTPHLPAKVSPGARPLRRLSRDELRAGFGQALMRRDGLMGAHCVHELWLRGEIGMNIEAMLEQLWQSTAGTVPDWLPMRHFDALPVLYDVAARFRREGRGRSNLYIVLLDYADRAADPFGFYVGMTQHRPAERFEQHKAGIRAAGSVLQRGLELLPGPVRHLQALSRAQAEEVEVTLAEALRAAGLFVKGGH